MKKIRLIALLTALCLLLCCFTACKRKDEHFGVTGTPGGQEETDREQEQQPAGSREISARNLTEGIATDTGVRVKEADAAFIAGQMDLSVELLKKAAQKEGKENLLLSPISVTMALAMTANGAKGKTAAEMRALLGGHSMEDLNAYLYAWRVGLPAVEQGEVKTANSIWIREMQGFKAEDSFLHTNIQYYNSEVYSAPFDQTTVRDVNQWVSDHTDGMISHLLDQLEDDQRMMLINALTFEAEWQTPYQDYQVSDGTFTSAAGKKQKAEFMHSSQSLYLQDEGAIGILREYKGGRYSFGALMPEDMDAYLADLSGEKLQSILQNPLRGDVRAYLPKFKAEYGLALNDSLKEMGMVSAFAPGADFTGMGNDELYIDQVLHKTYIEVDTWGTKAAAVTAVVNVSGAAPSQQEPKVIRLDRPFIYFIIDNETNLPLFIGTLQSLK